MSLTPYAKSSLAIVKPAAPAPLMTHLQSLNYLLTTLAAFIKPAKVTIAVPC